MPCTRLTVKQVFLSHLSQRHKRKLWFWCNLLFANGTSSMVHSRSSPWCSPRLIHISLPIVVHDHSVSLTAAQSGLQTAPVRRMRWTYHHLFQSSEVLSAKWPTWQESFSWHTLFTNIVICNHYAIYMPSIRWTFWVMASIRRLSLNRGVSSQHPLELQWNTLAIIIALNNTLFWQRIWQATISIHWFSRIKPFYYNRRMLRKRPPLLIAVIPNRLVPNVPWRAFQKGWISKRGIITGISGYTCLLRISGRGWIPKRFGTRATRR